MKYNNRNPFKTIRIFSLFFGLILQSLICFTQIIKVNSINSARQSGGDTGYTLDGSKMEYSRAKLLKSGNFGLTGFYPKTINIHDGYQTSGSLTQISSVPTNEIFFFGWFNKNDASLQTFTEAEIDSLYNWSKRGGKLIIGTSPDFLPTVNSSILNTKWGFSLVPQGQCSLYPTPEGNASDIFNGPFGNVPSASEGGSLQGFFTTIPDNSIVLAKEAFGNPTLFLDCNTLDLIVADIDVFTSLGGISNDSNINNSQDIFLANVFAYMDKIQDPPIIINNDNILLCTSTYSNYQWYLNGKEIPGATRQECPAIISGIYSVGVTLNCGCKSRSNSIEVLTNYNDIFIPNVFSPNGDGYNDTWEIINIASYNDVQIKIFNRWGNAVFTFDGPGIEYESNQWDGTYKGKKLPFASYVYIVKLNGEEQIFNSIVTIKH